MRPKATPVVRTMGVVVAALIAILGLAACEPPPPPDGSDLGVVLVSPPSYSSLGGTALVVAGVTNHGTAPAVGARVGYVVPNAVTVVSVTGSRVGACTGPSLVAGTSSLSGSCDLGTLAVGASTTVEIELLGVTPISTTDLHVLVSSPGEPGGFGSPNMDTFGHRVVSSNTIIFADPGPVPVGSSFSVHGSAGAASYPVLEYISLSVPSYLRLDSVTVSGMLGTDVPLPASCLGTGTGASSCQLPAAAPFDSMTFNLTALGVGGPASVSISSTSEVGGAYGATRIQVVDPAITSDVHVEYEPVSNGVLDEVLTVRGSVIAAGPVAHADVNVTTEVPAGFVVQSATWGAPNFSCATSGSTVTCPVGPLAGYRSEPLTLELLPTATTAAATITTNVTSSTPQDSPDPHPDSVQLAFPVYESFVDLGMSDVSLSATPFVQGTVGLISLDVVNHGTSTATGVTLTAVAPVGLVPLRGDLPQPSPAATRYCTVTGQTITCNIGDMAAGASQAIRLQYRVDAPLSADVELAVAADQPEVSVDPHPNGLTVPVTAVATQADLEASFLYTPLVAVVGQAKRVQVRVAHLGGALVPSTTVSLTIPAGWTLAGYDPTLLCAVTGDVVSCTRYWGLSSGQTFNVSFSLIAPAVASGTELTATVAGTIPDPDPVSNQVTETIDVVAQEADMGLVFSGTGATLPSAPSTRFYTFDYTNHGPAVATGVVLTATFPTSVTVLRAASWCAIAANVVTCTEPNALQPGSTIRLGIEASYADVTQPLTHTFAVTADQPEPATQTAPNSLNVVMQPAPIPGRITGTVTLPGGAPAAGVEIRARRPTDTWIPSGAATTAADGSFSMGNLPSGQYRVRILPTAASGYPSEWYNNKANEVDAMVLTVTAAGEVHTIQVELGLSGP
ncbi:MAG: carboxypeptidase regulatory-like domain-containing protein [Aquihabitans sp.]